MLSVRKCTCRVSKQWCQKRNSINGSYILNIFCYVKFSYLGTCPLKEIPLRPNDLVDKNTRPGKLQNSCRPGPGDPVPVKTAGIAGIDARPGKLQNSCRPGPGDPVPVKTAGIAGIDARPGKLQNSCRPGPGDPVPVKTAGIAGIDARPGKLQNTCHPGPGCTVPVETKLTYTNAVQLIPTTENIKAGKKHENNEKK